MLREKIVPAKSLANTSGDNRWEIIEKIVDIGLISYR